MVPGSGAETDLLLRACIVLQMAVIVPFFNLEWLLYLFQLTERRLQGDELCPELRQGVLDITQERCDSVLF